MSRRLILSAFLGLGILAGCASYKPAQSDEDAEAQGLPGAAIVVEQDSIKVCLHPVFEKMAARKYFGIDPAASLSRPAEGQGVRD